MKTPVWFALALMFSACAHDFGLMKLDEQVNGYGAAIRWNQFKRATEYLSAPPQSSPNWARLKDTKVTAYRVTSRERSPSGSVMTQNVEIGYILPGSVVEKTLTDNQRWHYDDDKNRWLLDSGLPSLN